MYIYISPVNIPKYDTPHIHGLIIMCPNKQLGFSDGSVFTVDVTSIHSGNTHIATWGFPETEVAPKHPLQIFIFHCKQSGYWGTFMLGNLHVVRIPGYQCIVILMVH